MFRSVLQIDKNMVLMRKEILDIVRAGGNVTHMLTVEVANSAAAEDAEREALVLALLANKPITRRLRGQHDVTLTWRPVGDGRSPHALLFYCDSQFFNDVAVANHTEIVLREILRPAVGDVFVTVTKPLFRSVAMVDEEVSSSLRSPPQFNSPTERNNNVFFSQFFLRPDRGVRSQPFARRPEIAR